MSLPKLHVFEQAVSVADVASALKQETHDLMDFATDFYGAKTMRVGDHIGRMIGGRLFTSEYAPYMRDIKDSASVLDNRLGVRTLQHSVSIGCSSIVRDTSEWAEAPTPTLMGTIDWQQVGENLSPVVYMGVLENPVKPEKPILSAAIGPMAFGLFMMNDQVVGKLNRAPIPNIKNPDLDLSSVNEEDYAQIKKRNNKSYLLKTVADTVFRGYPPAPYLLRHAINQDMSFEDTVDYIQNTRTSDFAIITLAGTKPGQAVTIEKHRDESYVYSGYEAATNHWNPNGDFGKRPSLPRTLNSEFRACAMADQSRLNIFTDNYFSFANSDVVDETTRVLLQANPSTGRMSLMTTLGAVPTSQTVTAVFDGKRLNEIEHFALDMS